MSESPFKPVSDKDMAKRPGLASDLDIQTRFPVREVLEVLKEKGIDLGYSGLRYYRNLGLIPPPEKGKGSNKRFYDVLDLQERIMAIKLMSSMFNLNYQEIASYANRLPYKTFNKLPLGLMKVYVDVQAELDKKTTQKEATDTSDPFDLWMFEGIKLAFLKAVDEVSEQAKEIKPENFYLKIVKQRIISQGLKSIMAKENMVLKASRT